MHTLPLPFRQLAHLQLASNNQKKALYHLSLTSKRLNALTTPFIYRDIDTLLCPSSFPLLDRLISSPKLSGYVSSIKVWNIPLIFEEIYAGEFENLPGREARREVLQRLADAIQCMPRLYEVIYEQYPDYEFATDIMEPKILREAVEAREARNKEWALCRMVCLESGRWNLNWGCII
ncbi:hypothetical protein K440DRAFT_609489 [Wilcoxina mikolae CBS 423.85]|nr:hypothetical protein K440DRAFT_609489 [Wilcoxina mikolae CBS 423.85]